MDLTIIELVAVLIRRYWDTKTREHFQSLNLDLQQQPNENPLAFLTRLNTEGRDLEIIRITNSLLKDHTLESDMNLGRQIQNKPVRDWISDLLELFEADGYDAASGEVRIKDDYVVETASTSGRPSLSPSELQRKKEIEDYAKGHIPPVIPPKISSSGRNGNGNGYRKLIVGIIIIVSSIVGITGYSIYVDVDINNPTITNSPDAEIDDSNTEVTNSPGAVAADSSIVFNNSPGSTVNTENADSKKGISDAIIFQIYRDTEPYSIEWTSCGQLSQEKNIYGETINWTMSFTPVLLDKNGKPSDVPFNTIFTFDVLGNIGSSTIPIEYDQIKIGPHIVNPKSNSPIVLTLTDAFESGKENNVDWIEIKLVKEKRVPYLPNSDDNYGDFIPADKDIVMTHLAYIKEPVEWSKAEIGNYKCNDLFQLN